MNVNLYPIIEKLEDLRRFMKSRDYNFTTKLDEVITFFKTDLDKLIDSLYDEQYNADELRKYVDELKSKLDPECPDQQRALNFGHEGVA